MTPPPRRRPPPTRPTRSWEMRCRWCGRLLRADSIEGRRLLCASCADPQAEEITVTEEDD